MNTRFFRHNDMLYLVIQEIPESKINDKKGDPNLELLKAWRDWRGADHVLRLSHSYLLCETIEDVEIISYENTVEYNKR